MATNKMQKKELARVLELLAAFMVGGALVFLLGGSVSRSAAPERAASPRGGKELTAIREAIEELQHIIERQRAELGARVPLESQANTDDAGPSLTAKDVRELERTIADFERALSSFLPVRHLMGRGARAVDYVALEPFLAATGNELESARGELSLLTVAQLVAKFGSPSRVEMVNGLLRLQWYWEGHGFVACYLAQGYVVNSQFWTPDPTEDKGR